MVANSEQYLSTIAARRLLTYEKITEPVDGGERVLDILEDFRWKLFTRDEKEQEERRAQKNELKEKRMEAAKRFDVKKK